jgi:hypothetical protein
MNSDPDHMLRELLAVIHRDGGHYTADVGLEQSFADAVMIVTSTRMALEEMERHAPTRWSDAPPGLE